MCRKILYFRQDSPAQVLVQHYRMPTQEETDIRIRKLTGMQQNYTYVVIIHTIIHLNKCPTVTCQQQMRAIRKIEAQTQSPE